MCGIQLDETSCNPSAAPNQHVLRTLLVDAPIFNKSTRMSAHYKDLSEQYSKNMAYHGMGVALFEPLAAEDMLPPCCGFFDQNHDWNHIAHLSVTPNLEGFGPLREAPTRLQDMYISWQPKTSLGVRANVLDLSADTPSVLSAGADAHIKYSTQSKFGAILMTTNPIYLVAYNQKRLFMSWLEDNKAELYRRYGPELKRFGLWIVTRTHCAPHASINVWTDCNKDAIVSMKAKAAMLGELGEEMSWKDQMFDKDWSHYGGKTPNGVVVFMDGINIRPIHWWMEGMRLSLRLSRDQSFSSVTKKNSRHVIPMTQQQIDNRRRHIAEPEDDYDVDEQILKDIGAYSQFSRSSRNSVYIPSARQSIALPVVQ